MTRDNVKIESIETIPISVPLHRVYSGSYYRMRARCTIITRIRTSDGVVGEAYNADSDEEQVPVLKIINEELAPLLAGKDATNIEGTWELMRDATTLDQLRDRRLPMQAIASIDTALWDAAGKRLGQPLYKLWGGYRNAVPVISIGGYYGTDDDELRKDAEFCLEHGYSGMKFKVGGMSPEEDARRTRVIREFLGEDKALVCDANQGWTTREAIEYARRTEDLNLRWFEEPCRWHNDRRAMRDVRHSTGVPVAAGQSEISASAMRDLMVDSAIDVTNFDASWGGGPTEWRRVASMADVFEVEVAHHEEAQLSMHLLASIPGGTYVEVFTPQRDPIFWNLLVNRPEVNDGRFAHNGEPGLGWELDEDYIEKYRSDK